MGEVKIREIRQWLIKAEHGLRSARRLFTDQPPLLDTAAYHCQQAVEKALKAFLVCHEISFEKTHLLMPLVEQCIDVDEDFDIYRDAAEELTPYATSFRYPGDVLDPDPRDVEQGMALADKIVTAVIGKISVKVDV